MIARALSLFKKLLSTSVPEKDKTEFVINNHKINIARLKMTAIAFIILETIMLTVYFTTDKDDLSPIPYTTYGTMYMMMLLAMVAFLVIFTKFGMHISKYRRAIRNTGILFISFILAWCAGISLLDQFTNGQVIVYVVALIAIAVTPIYEPMLLWIIYFVIHLIFLIFMPYFQKSADLVFANSVNSTAFLIMSWVISFSRYKKQVEDFINKKVIQEKNNELARINMELEQVNQKLETLSQTDALTGIYNRFMFEMKMQDEWNRCKEESLPLSLIMADIDYFKSFNDQYGHQAGDDCLKKIAGVLSACANGSSQIVARYGGEEFVIVLPHTQKQKAIALAEQIRISVEKMAIQHLHSDISATITISLGVNTINPSGGSSVEEFIYKTDKALYKAKERRNCIRFA